MTPVNPREEVEQIASAKKPPRRKRATYGKWVEPAKVVDGLVKKGWTISDAIREVITRRGYVKAKRGTDEARIQAKQAFDGLRAAFYIAQKRKVRKQSEEEFGL